MIEEARMERDEHGGLGPASEGWFVLNVADARWGTNERFGAGVRFETPEARFSEMGVNVHVLWPDQPACHYHRENCQEDFLVLFGQCKVLIEEEERELEAWDLVHCPPGVNHVFVGSGDGPCAVLMLGDRKGEAEEITYPVSALAKKYGGSVEEETDDPAVSYAKVPRSEQGPNAWASILKEAGAR